jgi:hypothetical protein
MNKFANTYLYEMPESIKVEDKDKEDLRVILRLQKVKFFFYSLQRVGNCKF